MGVGRKEGKGCLRNLAQHPETIFPPNSLAANPNCSAESRCIDWRKRLLISLHVLDQETPPDRDSETMPCIWPLLFIFMLDGQGLVAADPVSDLQGSSEQNDWCDDHNKIHRRLDTIQEVEKTVDHLDSEVKSLLNTVSESAWSIPLAPGTPLMDIFEDTS
ncbi:placenta-specific protein 9 isoform X2 [Rhineura floridana]|uniref:placenta-specific protein 9 isoform X2 n=1 Tax=Rhineura floridana TaxID=261503 RepID=UPI002AC7F48E|nr:placenta-specific protein 9 isoform X2 [Rhineura floridana]